MIGVDATGGGTTDVEAPNFGWADERDSRRLGGLLIFSDDDL